MIDLSHVGKRISRQRKGLGLSQEQLAQMLGVSSQAVSKWECGRALPDLDRLLDLSRLFHLSVNQLLEDENLIARLTGLPADPSKIAYFQPKTERPENTEWVKRMRAEGWIERNWKESRNPVLENAGWRIAQKGGIILEIGAGPGGGFVPYILRTAPEAVLIVSDLSPTVVEEWKKLLDREIGSHSLYYAVLDFCRMPFLDGCIDVVSDCGGIGNAEGDRLAKQNALKEAYRVLKPGGMLVTTTGFVTKETRASLPEKARKKLLEERPDIFEDLYEDTVLAGFRKIDSEIGGGWSTDGDDSTVADLARSLGVNLRFTSYIRYCYK